MKKRIMIALIGCALLFGSRSAVLAVDAWCGIYAYHFDADKVTAEYSDHSYYLCGADSYGRCDFAGFAGLIP